MDRNGTESDEIFGKRSEQRQRERRESGNHQLATGTKNTEKSNSRVKRMTRGYTFKKTFDKRMTELQIENNDDDDEKNILKIIYGKVRGFTTNKYGRLKE